MLKQLDHEDTKFLFEKVVKGRNPLTPYVVKYTGVTVTENPNSNILVELSCDYQQTMFGVTIVRDNVRDNDNSQAFEDRDEAEAYINKITMKELLNGK